MNKKEIDNLRDKIDKLDNKIISILDERSLIVKSIGKLKNESKNVVDIEREQSILERLLKNLKGYYSKDSIVRIWRELFYASAQLQRGKELDIISKRGIDDIKVYKGGKFTIKGQTSIIKLSSNESAFGPSTNIEKIILKENSLHRYPEINGQTLREQLSALHSIHPDQIVLGNGSDEILLMIALAFCHSGDEVIHAKHGFEMYPIIVKAVGAVSVIAEEINYKVSIDSILQQITPSTKIMFIANPNNPTGTYLNRNDLSELFLRTPKNIVVVIDGAYSEYAINDDYESSFNFIDKYKNVIFTKTFSKAYGLAGIRLGWCYTSKKIASILNNVQPPFNVNTLALKIASIALKDKEHLKQVIAMNTINKEWFRKELKKLNIDSLPSETNFIFIKCNSDTNMAEKINSLLLANGIIIRQLHSYGLPNCLRITIGTKKEMEKIIEVLRKGNLSS